jgi:hypothetical protein
LALDRFDRPNQHRLKTPQRLTSNQGIGSTSWPDRLVPNYNSP